MMGIDDIIGAGLQILNKYIPDTNAQAAAAAELKAQMLSLSAAQDHDQAAIDQTEAGNVSVWVAGWRPAIGWVCAGALFYQYLGRPLLAFGFSITHTGAALPAIPALDDNLWQLVFAMLGMGGLRTFEKLKGVTTGAH